MRPFQAQAERIAARHNAQIDKPVMGGVTVEQEPRLAKANVSWSIAMANETKAKRRGGGLTRFGGY